jgi:hypothetical protein
MSGSGRGGDNRGNRRRSFNRRREQNNDRNSQRQDNAGNSGKKAGDARQSEGKFEKNRGGFYERPRWTPPALSTEPIPVPVCPYCDKPIRELASALTDKNTGQPVHFDCVIAKIGESETLEPGDTISYIGGGRFGIVHFDGPPAERDVRGRPDAPWRGPFQGPKDFRIKKILEWENKEERAEWRRIISDHFSVT